jgi:hypothetical protein
MRRINTKQEEVLQDTNWQVDIHSRLKCIVWHCSATYVCISDTCD